MFLSPRWEGDIERDDCASSSNSSVTEKGLSDTVDREAFPRKEREHAHRIWPKGGPNPILQQSPLLGEKKRCQFVSFLNSRIERTSLKKGNRPRPLNQAGVPGIP